MNDTIIAFAAHHPVINIHYHHCYQVVVSLKNTFDSTINGKLHTGLRGFIINRTVKHFCTAPEISAIVLLIEPESQIGWQIKTLLGGEQFMRIEALFSPKQLLSLQVAEAQLQNAEVLNETCNILFEMLFPNVLKTFAVESDSRLQVIQTYIENHIEERIVLDDIARLVFLSSERVRHLFVQDIGMPFSQYLLWKRIKNVMYDVLKNNTSIMDAALKNGFTDQAHFSKIFKRMFGTSAKPLLKNSRYIQFLWPRL